MFGAATLGPDSAATNASRAITTMQCKLAIEDLISSIQKGGSYGRWWATELGRELYIAIGEDVGRPMSRKLRRTRGLDLEPLDISSTAVVLLATEALRMAVCGADDPMAYLARSIQNKLVGSNAPFTVSIDQPAVIADPRMQICDVAERATSLHPSTRIEIAEELTASCLRQHTPARLHGVLDHVVAYFSAKGESRIAHALTEAVKDDALLQRGIVVGEIRAIGNAVLGSRFYDHANSILGAFIRDNAFNPAVSRDHAAALTKYARRMKGEAIC